MLPISSDRHLRRHRTSSVVPEVRDARKGAQQKELPPQKELGLPVPPLCFLLTVSIKKGWSGPMCILGGPCKLARALHRPLCPGRPAQSCAHGRGRHCQLSYPQPRSASIPPTSHIPQRTKSPRERRCVLMVTRGRPYSISPQGQEHCATSSRIQGAFCKLLAGADPGSTRCVAEARDSSQESPSRTLSAAVFPPSPSTRARPSRDSSCPGSRRSSAVPASETGGNQGGCRENTLPLP